jgi:predicted metalloendopeptidase
MKASWWLMAALAALAGGYWIMQRNDSMEHSGTQHSAAGTPAAGRAPGIDAAGIDRNVRPQDDLYEHVNGRWLAETSIPEDKSNYGAFAQLADRAEEQIRAIIEEAAASDAPPGSERRKIGDFYASFMNTERVEALGLAPLEAQLARIDALAAVADLVRYLGFAQRTGVSVPLGFYVNQDERDTTTYIVYFGQAGLGLPDRDYYFKEEERFAQVRAAYVKHVARTLGLAGLADPAGAADRVVALETRLAEQQWTQVRNRDREATYNRYDAAGAGELMPGFPWPMFLEACELDVAAPFVVSQPSYFEALAALLRETPLAHWRDYLRWQLLRAWSPYLSQAFVDADFDFYGRTLRGIAENRPRWKRGVEVADAALGEAIGQEYVARHFRPEAKARMDALVANLREAFRRSLDELDWMSPETKQEAHAKLAKFNTKIGYPEQWKDYSALTVTADALVGNLVRSQEVEYRRQTAKLGRPIDRGEWFMTPQTVNAYYNPSMNEIVFPAAILQPPFFDVEADDAVNYGAIGAVIGHELSHGFDDQGRKSDGDGNLRDWWTQRDAEEFTRRTQGLVEQYARYNPVDDLHVNGELTLGENIADLAGLTLAHRAYRLSLGGRPAPAIEGYTGDQRFFMGWSQVWRRKYRDDELRRRLLTDPHSPSRYRVIGVVAHMPAFYDAFQVVASDRMYLAPEARISLW